MTKSKTTTQTEPEQAAPAGPKGKLGSMLTLLLRSEGATLQAMQDVTGWQAHSVRGAMSGALKKRLGFTIVSEKTEAGRVYRAIRGAGA